MKYKEVKGDLFKVSREFTLVHCIATDCAMGAGIATQFVKRNPGMRKSLLDCKPMVGNVLYYKDGGEHDVLNLITKKYSNNKPTRGDFNLTIDNLKKVCGFLNIKKLAMPLIGSGLDKLNWRESSNHIKETFKDTDIEILVVVL